MHFSKILQVVHELIGNNLLDDKQYRFPASKSTADVLTVITHKSVRWVLFLYINWDILKAFGNVFSAWSNAFTHERSVWIFYNATVIQCLLFGPAPFLLVINDQPKNILRSLANDYAVDTTVYGRTSKNQNNWSFAVDLSSKLANGKVTAL